MAYTHPLKGNRLAYNDNRLDRQPMVFVHGLPTAKELFSPVARKFDKTYRVIAVDLLGYGQSSKPEQKVTLRQHAANLKSLFYTLGLKDIILVSHGLGAAVAIELNHICPELIANNIFISPPVYSDFTVPVVVKVTRNAVLAPMVLLLFKNLLLKLSIKRGLMNKKHYHIHLKDAVESAFSGSAGRRALLNNIDWGKPSEEFAQYPTIISRINIPSLVIIGSNDPYIPIAHAEQLGQDIPKAQLIKIPRASHYLPIDCPDAVTGVIANFLQRLNIAPIIKEVAALAEFD